MAPINAKLKVRAIGLNIFPSTPLNDKIGIKTISMISCPNTAEFIIFEAPSSVILFFKLCFSLAARDRNCVFSLVTLNAINSTIMTAPSMIIPKSIAPKLIKLASTPNRYIKEKAKSKQRGMTEATMRPDRKFPNNKTTTKMTIRQPSIKFSMTVCVVLLISSLRSKKGFI